MRISFSKYQGAGNDFILIEDIDKAFPVENHKLIKKLCDRRFGIGADGLMLLRGSEEKDFTMLYFNANGYKGTMCGNGGRCLVAFAKACGYIDKENDIIFDAVDGEHRANILKDRIVSLKMKDVSEIQKMGQGYCVDTGSTHHVEYVDKLVDMDVYRCGRTIRAHDMYSPEGCNVNFLQVEANGSISIRTYERGVENETLACGTGSIAAAIVHHSRGNKNDKYILNAKGGTLTIKFDYSMGAYKNIWLEGPATFVYKGVWEE